MKTPKPVTMWSVVVPPPASLKKWMQRRKFKYRLARVVVAEEGGK